jgi:hypothetical protein
MPRYPYRLAVLLRKLHEAGCGPIRPAKGELRCRWPAHDDGTPSLYLGVTADRILVRCGAACTAEAVCDRLDHDLGDLFLDGDAAWVEVDDDYNITNNAVSNNTDVVSSKAAGDTALVPVSHHDNSINSEVTSNTEVLSSMATLDNVASPAAPDPVAFRAAVYNNLLDRLELSTTHFDALRQRGLTPEEIARRGYRTAVADRVRKAVDALLQAHGREPLLTVPGFSDGNGRVVFAAAEGLLVPVRDARGRVVALKVRHDPGHGGPKYTWVSSRAASSGNPAHVPLGVAAPAPTVRLTEGELKADVATFLSSIPTISAPGVTSWAAAVPALKALGAKTVLLAMD